jgi:hypothetical protein
VTFDLNRVDDLIAVSNRLAAIRELEKLCPFVGYAAGGKAAEPNRDNVRRIVAALEADLWAMAGEISRKLKSEPPRDGVVIRRGSEYPLRPRLH